MNGELIWVLSLLAVAIVLFATGRVRMDAVALFVIVAFALSGTLTVPEVFSGFSDPNVVLIAALFIIGDGLVRTGVATVMGTWLVKVAGNSEIKMLVLLMLTVAGLGAFMSSTGVVAIFIPVVLSVAMRMQTSPSRLMMPLSFAGLISGMMTLVATPPNLVVNSELLREGYHGFSNTYWPGRAGAGYFVYVSDAFHAERGYPDPAARRLDASNLSRSYP